MLITSRGSESSVQSDFLSECSSMIKMIVTGLSTGMYITVVCCCTLSVQMNGTYVRSAGLTLLHSLLLCELEKLYQRKQMRKSLLEERHVGKKVKSESVQWLRFGKLSCLGNSYS